MTVLAAGAGASASYHSAAPRGPHAAAAGYHHGPADLCVDDACHGWLAPTDPAADIEVMAFMLATGQGLVEPKAVTAAVALLVAQARTAGHREAADWLRAEYTGPVLDLYVRRAADRLTQQAAQIQEGTP